MIEEAHELSQQNIFPMKYILIGLAEVLAGQKLWFSGHTDLGLNAGSFTH